MGGGSITQPVEEIRAPKTTAPRLIPVVKPALTIPIKRPRRLLVVNSRMRIKASTTVP